MIAEYADIALTNRVNGLMTLNAMDNHDLVALPLAIQKMQVYHYLHIQHADLVPRVDLIIQTMRQSGELETLIKYEELKVTADSSEYQ